MERKKIKLGVLALSALFFVVGILFFPKIAQDHDYHHFANRRTYLGIPNCADVLSNIPLLFLGIGGALFVRRHWKDRSLFFGKGERVLWFIFFLAVAATGLGSAYYHLDPNDKTLFWDRLPMSVAFTALFSILFSERVSAKAARFLAPLFILAGAASVIYWQVTELMGEGDIRFYALIQFGSLLGIALLALLLPKPGSSYLWIALGWYAVAKACEVYDHQIMFATNWAVSGHTLKHLSAAVGILFLFLYLRCRVKKPV